MRTQARRLAFRFGLGAETRAAWWLRVKGYRVLARRFRGGGGEIDLIVRRGRVVAFVEVKARSGLDDAILSFTPAKLRQVGRAARAWISREREAGLTYRLDAVAVAPGRVPRHTADVMPLEEA